jgi:hypothetical protein
MEPARPILDWRRVQPLVATGVATRGGMIDAPRCPWQAMHPALSAARCATSVGHAANGNQPRRFVRPSALGYRFRSALPFKARACRPENRCKSRTCVPPTTVRCQTIFQHQPGSSRFQRSMRVPRTPSIDPLFIAMALQPERERMNTQERTTATRPGKITATHLTTLGSRLTDRDRQIALDCYDHRVLTTEQLLRLHFGGLRITTLRLGTLYQLRVLDRFRPPRRRPGTGTNPYHWILDEAGAHVVAAQRDMERRRLRWQHSDAVDIAQSSKLRHHIEINEFFSLLSLEAQLQHGALHEWYGERITSTLFKGVVPDGYGVINLPRRPPVHLLLELDRGTEPARRLHDKAVLYARQVPRSQLGEHDAFVVLTVPTATRAKLAREAVAGTGAPIVVAEWSKASTHSPLGILTDAADRIAARRLAPATDRPA